MIGESPWVHPRGREAEEREMRQRKINCTTVKAKTSEDPPRVLGTGIAC